METAFNNELELLANRDALFLSFTNRVLNLYSGLSGNKIPEFQTIESFLDYYRIGEGKRQDLAITALIYKVFHIIYEKGSPVSVVPFLKRICRTKKKQTQPGFGAYDDGKFLGVCHFRWNYKGYDLSDDELSAIKMYLGLPILETVNGEDVETISFKHFGLSAVLVNQGISDPWGSDGKRDRTYHNKFKVTVISGMNGLKTSFDFYGSHHDWQNKVEKLEGNDLTNAFQCFVSDGVSSIGGFENFCGEFGYDEDSRKSEKIFKECEKSLNKLLALGVSDSQAYDLLNELLELENA